MHSEHKLMTPKSLQSDTLQCNLETLALNMAVLSVQDKVECVFTTLGSLWVPPAPGSSPSMTSGVPNTVFLLFVAIL